MVFKGTGDGKKMKKLMAIGEALIDFIPEETGKPMKGVSGFKPAVGGAPANVCGAYRKLGGAAEMITQLGNDPFGDKIVEEFKLYDIGTDHVLRTDDANTSLAFVALKEDGNREFSFYRKPGADMLMTADVVEKDWFENAFALHFCSVSLGDFPMKEAHKRAIEYAKEKGAIISFDPNIRLALWKNPQDLKKAIYEFMPLADILKVSDEEIEFITGKSTVEEAFDDLFTGNVKMVIYTKGADGAECYTRKAKAAAQGEKVKAYDTTGAGDAFIGSFLYQLSADGVEADTLENVTVDKMEQYLAFSNRYCAESVTKAGAIASYPDAGFLK